MIQWGVISSDKGSSYLSTMKSQVIRITFKLTLIHAPLNLEDLLNLLYSMNFRENSIVTD